MRRQQRLDHWRLRVDIGQCFDDVGEHRRPGDVQHDRVLGTDDASDVLCRDTGCLGNLRRRRGVKPPLRQQSQRHIDRLLTSQVTHARKRSTFTTSPIGVPVWTRTLLQATAFRWAAEDRGPRRAIRRGCPRCRRTGLLQREFIWRLTGSRVSPDGIPIGSEVPVLTDAQAARQCAKLLHQFLAQGWLTRAPLIAPDWDGVGGACTEAQSGQSQTARCQRGSG